MNTLEKIDKWFLQKKLPKELRVLYLLGNKQIIYEKEHSLLVSVRLKNSHFEFWCPKFREEEEQNEN